MVSPHEQDGERQQSNQAKESAVRGCRDGKEVLTGQRRCPLGNGNAHKASRSKMMSEKHVFDETRARRGAGEITGMEWEAGGLRK